MQGKRKKTLSPFHRFRRKARVQKNIHNHLCAGLELGYSTEAQALRFAPSRHFKEAGDVSGPLLMPHSALFPCKDSG